jgi:hypothetical protein
VVINEFAKEWENDIKQYRAELQEDAIGEFGGFEFDSDSSE